MKSAWKSALVKDTFLPGTVYDEMKSAWKGAEVKDTFLLGTFMKRIFFCISFNYSAPLIQCPGSQCDRTTLEEVLILTMSMCPEQYGYHFLFRTQVNANEKPILHRAV